MNLLTVHDLMLNKKNSAFEIEVLKMFSQYYYPLLGVGKEEQPNIVSLFFNSLRIDEQNRVKVRKTSSLKSASRRCFHNLPLVVVTED